MPHILTILCRAESSHAQLKRQLGSSQGNFEACWTKIHSLLELQHTSIKASFEKSKTIVHYNFKPAEYKELRCNTPIPNTEVTTKVPEFGATSRKIRELLRS